MVLFIYDDKSYNWKYSYSEIEGDVDDYYLGKSVPKAVNDFKDSSTYDRAYEQYMDRKSYDDDWDSDSNWNSSDTWDSGSTNGDSDW